MRINGGIDSANVAPYFQDLSYSSESTIFYSETWHILLCPYPLVGLDETMNYATFGCDTLEVENGF